MLPHVLPHALVYALTTIFEELSQLDESRCVPSHTIACTCTAHRHPNPPLSTLPPSLAWLCYAWCVAPHHLRHGGPPSFTDEPPMLQHMEQVCSACMQGIRHPPCLRFRRKSAEACDPMPDRMCYLLRSELHERAPAKQCCRRHAGVAELCGALPRHTATGAGTGWKTLRKSRGRWPSRCASLARRRRCWWRCGTPRLLTSPPRPQTASSSSASGSCTLFGALTQTAPRVCWGCLRMRPSTPCALLRPPCYDCWIHSQSSVWVAVSIQARLERAAQPFVPFDSIHRVILGS